jgi:SAM-dependent methyltransferase
MQKLKSNDTKQCETERIDKLAMPHYMRRYEELVLAPSRGKAVRLLEIGIARGDSLYFWRDQLPHAKIIGLDIDPVDLDDPSGRIRTYVGEQQDLTLLDRIARENAPDGFDYVIDDGSHIGQYTRLAFWRLFERHLKPGGKYFIEDWGTSYWPQYPDGRRYRPPVAGFDLHERVLHAMHRAARDRKLSHLRRALGFLRYRTVRKRFPSHQAGMVGFIKELVDECGMPDITDPRFGLGPQRASRIAQLSISVGLVIATKAERSLPGGNLFVS